MFKLLISKVKYYKKSYLLKAVLLFALFTSLQIIGVIACNFSNSIFRYTSLVNDDYYYSTVNTDGDEIIDKVRSDYSENEYVAFHHFKSFIDDDSLIYITFYEGNPFLGGMGGIRFSFEVNGDPNQNLSVLTTSNYTEDSIEYLGENYKVTGKINVTIPDYLRLKFDMMKLKDVKFVLINKQATLDSKTESYDFYSFTFNKAKDEIYFAEKNISKGSEFITAYDTMFPGAASLFYAVYLVPYIFGLIFWAFLISLLDTITKQELSIFKVFGFKKSRAKRLYFIENFVLTIPGIIISELIFIPIFIFAFDATVFLPLALGGVALIYYLIYSIVYSSIMTDRIYRGFLI